MLQDENYAEINAVRIENVTSHKNNKVVFCTIVGTDKSNDLDHFAK